MNPGKRRETPDAWREIWLGRTTLLRGLSPNLIRHVALNTKEKRLNHQEILFHAYDSSDFIGFVIDGIVHYLLSNHDGRELITMERGPGDLIGEAALAEKKHRQITARACGPTRVLILTRRYFPKLLNDSFFLLRTLSALNGLAREATEYIETTCLYPLEARLARYCLAHTDPDKTQGGIHRVKFPPNQGILSAMINASRPKLNAKLQRWKQQGLICQKGRSVSIRDMALIRQKAFLQDCNTLLPR